MRTGKKHEPVTVQAKGEYKTSNVVSIFKAVASKKRGTSPPPIQCKAVLKGRGFKPKFLMRLISRKNLESAIESYPDDAKAAIALWRKAIKDDWESLEEIRQGYSQSVDQVCGYTIFNIKGNQYRLIVKINYKARIIYFKKFLTHTEYDKIKWNDKDEVKQKIG